MADSFDHGVHRIAWVGTRILSRTQVRGAGTWEIVGHAGCEGDGTLLALSSRDVAPLCPRCGAVVQWQLSHLAPSVAADHRGVGRLP
ncbi:MAG: hypothetical protein JXA83_15250 [Acidimicrobiales bacterium]|nr:hypothetical protein [Acidimicrobiales bacterium]